MKAVAAAAMKPGQAIEVGFGDGTETVALLGAGWSVLAIDATPQAAEVLGPQVPDDAADRLVIRIASAEMVELPGFDLLYAAYALSFLEPGRLPHLLGSGSGADSARVGSSSSTSSGSTTRGPAVPTRGA